ncbi:MAG: hypothetical protein MJ252_28430, partial [archaeon]|nr:hypothetical protein [archaeon]
NPYLEEPQYVPQNQAPVNMQQREQQEFVEGAQVALNQGRQNPQNVPVMPQAVGGGKILESNESSGVYEAMNPNFIHNVNNVQNTFGKGQMSNNIEDYNRSQYGIPLQDRPALKQGTESNESYGVSDALNSNFVPYDGSVGPQQILDISEYGPRTGPTEYKIGAGNVSSGVCGIFHGK